MTPGRAKVRSIAVLRVQKRHRVLERIADVAGCEEDDDGVNDSCCEKRPKDRCAADNCDGESE